MSDHPSNPETVSQADNNSGLKLLPTLGVIAVLLAVGIAGVIVIKTFRPEADKRPAPQAIVSVESIEAVPQDYPITINTNGTVVAATRSNLVAQVSGEITQVAEVFSSGGRFKKGDVLLQIDDRNYRAAVSTAQAALSQARVNYEQEQATAAQAEKDWQRLGFTEKPGDLVVRKPQLQAARAQLDSSRAALQTAKLDLSRTTIKAPYDGSIIRTQVDLGQFVSTGVVLAEIFADEGLEVQLPLNQNQFAQLDMSQRPEVILSTTLAGREHRWRAEVVRADNAFDTTTRQLNVTAKVIDRISDQGLDLKIGQYVSADVAGRIVDQAMVIPNQSIREGRYVFVYDNGILRRRAVDLEWQDDSNSIVSGLEPGEQVVTTSLGGAVNGARAQLLDNTAGQSKPQKAGADATGQPEKAAAATDQSRG